MATLHHLLWLATRRGLSPERALRVAEHFGSAEGAYFADPSEYELLPGGGLLRQSLLDKRMDGVERILADCDRLGVRILAHQDADYPERLRQLADAPLLLYVKGRRIDFDREVVIGMVGARQCTPYGVRMAGTLALELARCGAVVTSGIAQGIDGAALKGALQGGGTVVSVLGCGIDVVYPRGHEWLYRDVTAAGALISEYPPGTEPRGVHFPVRNRIISGLSVGVVAVEGEERSGTMITARLALDQDRDVFAVPGPADAPMSAGTNALIARGQAKLVRTSADIVEEYELRFPGRLSRVRPLDESRRAARLTATPSAAPAAPTPPEPAEQAPCPTLSHEAISALADQERELLALLGTYAMTADELVGHTEMPVRRVSTALTILQVQGYVTELPGKRFQAAVRIADR